MNLSQALGFVTGKPEKPIYPKHREESRKIAAEGAVLLRNQNQLLPIVPQPIALFGAGAVDTIVCGTGSGYIMSPEVIHIWKGMTEAGYTITSESWLKRFTAASRKANKEDKTLSKLDRMWSGKTILIDEPDITEADLAEASAADIAVYVIRRNAGEGGDRTAKKGDYYLSDQEYSNLAKLSAVFSHVVVIFNTCVMDAAFLEEIPHLDAALLIGQPGADAGRVTADILCGKVCPSGHLTDTWAKRYEDNPASATFAGNDGNSLQEDYTEDIFVGYRYFDTFGTDVMFPFGHGLSYTNFARKIHALSADTEQVSLKITVTNTGACAGKDLVQIYAAAPEGRLTKPVHELVAYRKTGLLQPGQSQNMLITFPVENLTSYDEEKAAFVLEAGDYTLAIGANSRDTQPVGVIRFAEEVLYRQVRNQLQPDHTLELLKAPARETLQCGGAADRMEDVSADFALFLLRPDFSEFTTIDGICSKSMAFSEAKADMTAILPDVVEGRVTMEEFVNSLDDEVLFRLVTGAANETKYEVPARTKRKFKAIGGASSSGGTTKLFVKSLGIPNWKVTDGPAGCHLPFCGVTAYPAGIVIAQTWNDKLAQVAGLGMGKELAHYGFSVLLGPGMNIHRDPLCGRAFEYFSEDPLLSGKMAAVITKGVQSTPGAGVSIKHFAANSQETDRLTQNSTISERALREIYLKGFEICVREAAPKTVMTSYNCLNGIHTSSRKDLLTDVLRGEWGFTGLVMTDWGTASNKAYDLIAGNDLIMGGYRTDELKAAVLGSAPEFAEDGYVKTEVQKVYGGFFTNIIEYWNVFEPDAQGPDVAETTVVAGKELNPKVMEKAAAGIAEILEQEDGSKRILYHGKDRGAYLPIEAVRACAARTLAQLADSVSYRLMMK